MFQITMGVPDMENLWTELKKKVRDIQDCNLMKSRSYLIGKGFVSGNHILKIIRLRLDVYTGHMVRTREKLRFWVLNRIQMTNQMPTLK